jgi:hypothetical protein
MEHYLLFNAETGALISVGQGPANTVTLQGSQLPDGVAIMQIPSQAVLALGGIDMAIIQASYAASIDADADKVRSMFITNTPGQMATYLEKEAEARRVLAGIDGETLFLSAEADAIGVSVADLAQEVVTQADTWRPIGARIEAARRKAKLDVASAPHLAALADAAKIDWQAIVSPKNEQVTA